MTECLLLFYLFTSASNVNFHKWILSDQVTITLDYRKHNSHHKEYSTGSYSEEDKICRRKTGAGLCEAETPHSIQVQRTSPMGELQLSHWEKLPNNIDHWPEICELDSE